MSTTCKINFRSKMSFELIFHNCSAVHQLEVEAFVDEFQNELETLEVQTSGSTGTPKKISLTKRQLIASAERTNAYFQMDEETSSLLCLSVRTIGGKMVLVRAIVGNYTVHVVEPKRNPVVDLLPFTLIDLASFAPIQFEAALNESPEEMRLIGASLLGGSAPSEQLERRILKEKLPVFVGYGMTETVSHIALRRVGEDVYTALDGVTIESTSDGIFISDTVLDLEILATDLIDTIDSTHFRWLGRADFVINSAGIKIHPEALEKVISGILTGSFAIIGLPHETWGEECVLVTDSALDNELFTGIQKRIEEKFGKYAVPKRYIRHSIPYLNGLKVNRKLLKQELNDQSAML